jgi:hypothetical protein
MMWLLLTLAVPGALIGFGVGGSSNNRWRGAIIGVAIGVSIPAIILALLWKFAV